MSGKKTAEIGRVLESQVIANSVDDEKVYCFAAIPREDYEIVDDWYALAMKGSGTKTLKIKNVFVPEYRTSVAKDMMEGRSKGFDPDPGLL